MPAAVEILPFAHHDAVDAAIVRLNSLDAFDAHVEVRETGERREK